MLNRHDRRKVTTLAKRRARVLHRLTGWDARHFERCSADDVRAMVRHAHRHGDVTKAEALLFEVDAT